MGDAGTIVEENILNEYDLSNITILKLGHHGSNTSSSDRLLNITNPQYSIISVSLNNKYNHPSKDTINKLNKYNLTYYETSKYGTIKFCFDDKNIQQNNYYP
jgi:competence protein ComEC